MSRKKRGLSRGIALGLAGAGAATATAAAYTAARRRRERGPIDLTDLDLAEDLHHRTVEVDDGGRIHVVEAGVGRPIVLLHGVTLSVMTWTYQLRDLSERYRVIAVDQRGHGVSEHGHGGFTIERMAADIASLLEELDLRDAIIVGHSMGGFVAQQMCVDHPEVARRVSGLVLLSTAAAIGQGVPGWDMMMRFFEPAASAVRLTQWRAGGWLPAGEVGMAMSRLAFGSKPDLAHVAHTHRMTGSIAGNILAQLTPGVARFDVRSRLHEIELPTLVISGRDLITPPRLGSVIARGMPNAEFEVVPHGGHMLMLERRDWLNARITAFAEQRVPGRAKLDVITDVGGVLVGHWTDRDAQTGCTVVLLPENTVASGEVRGGAPGTREFELLAPGRLVQHVNAVVLTGGSAFGLAACDGAMRWCEEHGVGYARPRGGVPIVVGAVIFDLGVGDASVRPGAAEGYAACAAAASGPVAEGRVGAGTGATIGKIGGPETTRPGGLGTSTVRDGDLIVSALMVVNAVGHLRPTTAPTDFPITMLEHTTIGVVATNARLDKTQCHLTAQSGHAGMARAIEPVHTSFDGDAIVVVATGAVDADLERVRAHAAEAVESAIRRAVG